MAELYVQQGHVDQALGIYRRLSDEQPDNDTFRQRIAELEALGQPSSVSWQGDEPMSFRESLQKVVESVPGAASAMVMGFDGIAIDSFEKTPGVVDLPTMLIEYSNATQQLRKAGESMPGIGELTELTITREGGACLLRPLTDEYFLAVVVQPGGLTGKARYMMRVAAPGLAADLS